MADQEERRGLDIVYDQVKEFHKIFNHPTSKTPITLDPLRKITRAEWMREEINEFLDGDGDVVAEADAMEDLIYFAVGTLVEMGIYKPQQLMDRIQKANMDKIFPDGKPHYRSDNKVIKPEGWQHPEPDMKVMISNMHDDR